MMPSGALCYLTNSPQNIFSSLRFKNRENLHNREAATRSLIVWTRRLVSDNNRCCFVSSWSTRQFIDQPFMLYCWNRVQITPPADYKTQKYSKYAPELYCYVGRVGGSDWLPGTDPPAAGCKMSNICVESTSEGIFGVIKDQYSSYINHVFYPY